MHHAANLALWFGLGYGLAARTADPRWAIAGFAAATGSALLNLHNDCRYKAFFQRLKSVTASYRVDGGSGGRPQPPAPWPGRGVAAIVWPAYKACEPHVVLLELTGLAVLAVFVPGVWLAFWRGGVRVFAVLAPVLGIARIARAVARDAVEGEFTRWFQPLDAAAIAGPTSGHGFHPVVSTSRDESPSPYRARACG
jgi:hypothetical protein